jgi:predicted phosphoribosyltransferase
VGEGGVKVVDREITELLGLTDVEIEEIARRVEGEIEERSRLYRRARGEVQLRERIALVVDDGIATGVTMDAAIGSARSRGAVRVIAAAPVSSLEAESRLKASADIFVCPIVDPGFIGVGAYYQEFSQLTDKDVLRLLRSFDEESAGSGGSPGPG